MPKQKPKPAREQPGPGRSTSEIAFNDLRADVAAANENAHREARKRRAAREQEQRVMRAERDF
jgi:hypothetical protein